LRVDQTFGGHLPIGKESIKMNLLFLLGKIVRRKYHLQGGDFGCILEQRHVVGASMYVFVEQVKEVFDIHLKGDPS
jgi:hypothetical protein